MARRALNPRLGIGALGQRDCRILRDIIHTHILSGEPVSSRTVSKQDHLSAATIRNVMADLEELGLLRQPHTSAGRVPTEAAYRFYVESLMQMRRLSPHEKRYIEESLAKASDDAEQLLSVCTHLLSELSSQVGVVLVPVVQDTVIKSFDFVSLGGRRVLCIVVSSSGFIDHVVIETEEELPRRELVRISNYLTRHFAGVSVRGARDRLVGLMAADRADVDRWMARAMTLARQAVSGPSEQEVLVEGTTALLDKPELSDVEHVRRMLDTFADRARLVEMLNQCLAGDGVRIFIGDDNDVTSELEFSLVAVPYGIDQRALGSLGIIGPSRMEYPRLVPLVRFLGETLSKALASGVVQ